MARIVQPVADNKPRNLMFWLPPQHGKSILVSKNLPAHILEKDSNKRIILGAYNYNYASDFSRSIKRILTDRKFKQFDGRQTANQWETSSGGFFKAFGMQSGITGTPADHVFIDDPIKSYAEAFSATFRDKIYNTFVYDIETREQRNTSYVIIQTRWHVDDLSGRLLERDGRIEDGGKWQVLSLPALAMENDPLGREIGEPLCPELHTKERLLERQKNEPSMFQALYQQSPVLDGGNIIKTEWFQYYNPHVIKNFDFNIFSIDGAWKDKEENDYSVCTIWGVINNNYYLINMWREKVIYPEFKKMIKILFDKYKPMIVLVEDTASGIPFIQEMKSFIPIEPVKPEGKKEVRVRMISSIIESNRVFLPQSGENEEPIEVENKIYDFLQEVSSFPKGKHDDIVDTMSQALRYLSLYYSGNPIIIL